MQCFFLVSRIFPYQPITTLAIIFDTMHSIILTILLYVLPLQSASMLFSCDMLYIIFDNIRLFITYTKLYDSQLTHDGTSCKTYYYTQEPFAKLLVLLVLYIFVTDQLKYINNFFFKFSNPISFSHYSYTHLNIFYLLTILFKISYDVI